MHNKKRLFEIKFAVFLLFIYIYSIIFLSECSVGAIADLVFLVDGSWSVGRENFKYIRNFISAVAGAFDIGEDKTRVAVVQYSTDTRTEFNLNQYFKRAELLQAIRNLPYKGGNTMTGVFYEPKRETNTTDIKQNMPFVLCVAKYVTWHNILKMTL